MPRRPFPMRRSTLAVGGVLLALAVAPVPPPAAVAGCAAPDLSPVTDVLEPGTSVTVEGRHFVEGCNDTGGCGPGCRSCEEEPVTPYADIELRLVQDGRTHPLGVADAGTAEDDRLGQVSWTFLVPPQVRSGPARLVTDYSEPVRVRIRIPVR